MYGDFWLYFSSSETCSVTVSRAVMANRKKRLIPRSITFATGYTRRKRKRRKITSLRKSDVYDLALLIAIQQSFFRVSRSEATSLSSRKFGPYFVLSRWLLSSTMWKIKGRIYLNVIRRVSIVTRGLLPSVILDATPMIRWIFNSRGSSSSPLSCVTCARVSTCVLHASPAWAERRDRSRCLCGRAVSSFDRIRHRSRRSRPYQRQRWDFVAATLVVTANGVSGTMRFKNPWQHGSYE